jgi:hypothetical protein
VVRAEAEERVGDGRRDEHVDFDAAAARGGSICVSRSRRSRPLQQQVERALLLAPHALPHLYYITFNRCGIGTKKEEKKKKKRTEGRIQTARERGGGGERERERQPKHTHGQYRAQESGKIGEGEA